MPQATVQTSAAPPPVRRVSIPFWLALAGIVGAWWFLVKAPAVERRADLDAAAALEKVELAGLRRKASALAARRRWLREPDPYYLEALARGRLGWRRSGEELNPPEEREDGGRSAR